MLLAFWLVPRESMSRPPQGEWKQVFTADGSWTLEHPVHGTGCHARHGAWLEARERFVAPCRLPELAKDLASIRLLDIGTGLGVNIAAALEATQAAGVPLRVVTLENSREVLERAVELGLAEPSASKLCRSDSAAKMHRIVLEALAEMASTGQTSAKFDQAGKLGSVQLLLGDARQLLPQIAPAQRFDAIFLDPFPVRKDPDLWHPSFLRAVAERLDEGGWLSTHSAAVQVRASLRAAGLEVGLGPRVGKKAAGTIARRGARLPAFDPPIQKLLETATQDLIEKHILS